MSYRQEQTNEGTDIVIDGFEKGISSSPYTGIANMRNVGISYYPSVAYVNYRRQAATLSESGTTFWYAGVHSVNVSDNTGWIFVSNPGGMTNPVQSATSPAGLNYVLDDSGQVWKQSAVNSSTFNLLGDGGRAGNGHGGLAWWNNYLVVFGNGMIEFNGNGTGDAGITSSNWNITPQAVASVKPADYNSLSITTPAGSNFATVWLLAPVTGDTSAFIASSEGWQGTSGTYPTLFGGYATPINVTYTNNSQSVTFSALPSATYTTSFKVLTLEYSSSATVTTFYQNDPVVFSVVSGALPSPLVAGTTYYLAAPVTTTVNSPIIVSATSNGPFIALTTTGSGSYTMTDSAQLLPIKNQASVNLTFSNVGANSGTVVPAWQYPTGTYNIIDPLGDNIPALFTFNSNTVTIENPSGLTFVPTGTYQVNIINPTAATTQAPYKAWVSQTTGGLYFCNGNAIGGLEVNPATTANFNPGLMQTYLVSYSEISMVDTVSSVVDITDLRGQMIFGQGNLLYTWDFVSASPSSAIPVGSFISSIINILNNIYVLAGQKGNIYISNGSSAQLLFKIPDYIAGVIDPIWSWGMNMQKRSKLWFQALAQSTSGTNLLAGIFSLDVSSTLVTDVETSGAFNMESQNSYGLTAASGALANGVLMNNEPSSNGQNSYYSGFSTGASTGGIDFNDTTLWQNNEAIMESEIIPIGNYLVKKTLGSIEFKLDRPLASGDSVSLYWRPSLTASYTQIPLIDTASALISNYGISAINQSQWAQFKITLSCASSNSSFIPTREIRLHLTQ